MNKKYFFSVKSHVYYWRNSSTNVEAVMVANFNLIQLFLAYMDMDLRNFIILLVQITDKWDYYITEKDMEEEKTPMEKT